MNSIPTYKYSTELEVPITDRIKHLRILLTLHSYIYYILNTNIISDHQWQAHADELTEIQAKYPEFCNIGWYDDEFVDWDGSTGYHLSKNTWVDKTAHYLLNKYAKT